MLQCHKSLSARAVDLSNKHRGKMKTIVVILLLASMFDLILSQKVQTDFLDDPDREGFLVFLDKKVLMVLLVFLVRLVLLVLLVLVEILLLSRHGLSSILLGPYRCTAVSTPTDSYCFT